jgi:hypothetical protein
VGCCHCSYRRMQKQKLHESVLTAVQPPQRVPGPHRRTVQEYSPQSPPSATVQSESPRSPPSNTVQQNSPESLPLDPVQQHSPRSYSLTRCRRSHYREQPSVATHRHVCWRTAPGSHPWILFWTVKRCWRSLCTCLVHVHFANSVSSHVRTTFFLSTWQGQNKHLIDVLFRYECMIMSLLEL